MTIPQGLDTARQFDDTNPLSFHWEPHARSDTKASWSSRMPLDGGNIYVTQDGPREAPALVLIHGLAASTHWWDALVPLLARSHRVIRIDMLGHGKSAKPAGRGYGIPEQGKRVGAALDRLGVKCAIVVGHSTGGSVATALAELRPDQVKALALIDSCPCLDADTSPGLLSRLMPVPVVGHLLWRLLTGAMTRKAMTTGFGRGYEIPQQLVDDVRAMTHHAFTATSRAALDYLEQCSLPDRLAVLGTPLLVMFGEEDRRCRSSSAAEYRAVPGARVELLNGVGHSPMVEDPRRTAALSVVMLASVACASTTPSEVTPASVAPDGTQQVTISVGDGMKFQPADVSVRAGQPLGLTLRNAGQSAHDLTLNQGVAQPVKLTVNGGEATSRTVTFDKPGTYEFECPSPGHALAGMRGTITVQ